MRLGTRSVWRSRAALFAVLGLLVLGNAAILVSHSLFYDVRLRALQREEQELQKRRDEARAAVAKVVASEARLKALRANLEMFYERTLGDRRERLASLVEEIYGITKKAGFIPDGFQFEERDVPGAQLLGISFRVSGRYEEIKRLIAAFENDPGFLVLEKVGVHTNEQAPDLLEVDLTVTHYFRSDGGTGGQSASARRRARESR